jgi:simple sugar transport system permease protein
MLYRTKMGYAIRIVGQNDNFARYNGININKTILLAQMFGGILAGFGGATEMLGMYTRFQYQALTQYGFDGMLIAIIARNNPATVPLAALFLAYIRTGADIMNRTSDVPLEIISVIQSAIIMLVVAKMFLNKFKHEQIVKNSRAELKKGEEAT